MAAVLEFADVTVRRGQTLLLDEINWSVEEDERWVILGPNGAGKTTLLQVAAAQIHPTSGVAGILGEVLGTVDVFDLRPRIGLTSAALADRIPRGELVHDVVVSASYGVLGRWREAYDDLDHDRAAALLAEVGAAHLAERTFGTLSEGERKRVQIARALMTDPEMLLLDEPAAGLDLGGREDLVSTLSRLALDPDSPATVLVSHHVEEIPPGFTHALMLRAGRVVAAGPMERVVTAETCRRPSACRCCSPGRTAGSRRADARPTRRYRLSTRHPIGSGHGVVEGSRVGDLARSDDRARRRRDVQPRPDPRHARGRCPRRHGRRPARPAGRRAGPGRPAASLAMLASCGPPWSSGCTRARAVARPRQAGGTAGPSPRRSRPGAGRIKLAGEFWTAQPYDDTSRSRPARPSRCSRSAARPPRAPGRPLES